MARFSLSFLSIFLVLAVLTLSMPTKRDEQAAGEPLGLAGTVGNLIQSTKLMDGLDKDSQKEKADKKVALKEQAKEEETKAYAKMAEKSAAAANPTPTPTPTKKLSSGNFVTPTTTPTHKPTSEPNALGNLPLIGGILGGTGVGL
ncbi:hypothetical protein PCG10_004320 [Penicillium crustosum]|uniref:Uncharacterized protein n=1 Tax=Penicillium crustosum TaxID=36656 RepID=A0A9P5GKP9_PENCR|nr:uncharacterized protein N7487_008797 [Penicillium crustosum]KAF7526089.1 hypothetical protein PCG10_004320 [Penicillium crustosum]KAJ5402901.1 hypothetical protein N7487_008797 [Penicillium crustosum]